LAGDNIFPIGLYLLTNFEKMSQNVFVVVVQTDGKEIHKETYVSSYLGARCLTLHSYDHLLAQHWSVLILFPQMKLGLK
jgi:hypothetical protein